SALAAGAVGVAVNRLRRHRVDRDTATGARNVLRLVLQDGRAGLAALQLGVFLIAGDVARRRARCRGAAGVIDDRDQAAAVAQILVVAGLVVEQIRRRVVVAADRRRQRPQGQPAAAVVLVVGRPGVAAARLLVDAEHHLAGVVGVDDVLVP